MDDAIGVKNATTVTAAVDTVEKIDENTVKVITTPEVKTVETQKTYDELEADLKQAQDSLVYIQQKHDEEIIHIVETITIMQKRLDDAIATGIIKREI